ncbi:hypothetical protein MJO28_016920 [Puccinia striiformis f. sp. tritici]|nr:hypothetical protein MJO28_016920 [Puccinia striiformis f. sp. tritici]
MLPELGPPTAVSFKRAIDYGGTKSLDSQAIGFLHKLHPGAIERLVDFDIMSVFLMQEFDKEANIQKIIQMINVAFNDLNPPLTTLQHQIVEAAALVQSRISKYQADSLTNPTTKKLFCLRFPTYSSFIAHSIALEQKCEVLPNDSMIILIDEGGICVGVGLPPKPRATDPKHMPRDVRAQMCLDGLVSTNVIRARNDKVLHMGSTSPVAANLITRASFPSTPFPLSLQTRGEVRSTSDAKTSTCSFQAYGYGLGSPLSAGSADKSIPCLTHRIKTDELQGRNFHSEPKPNLPEPLRSQTGPTFQGLAQLRHDLVFYSRISYWINKTFLPKSSAIAEKNITYLFDKGSTAANEGIGLEHNPIIAARTVTVNTQPLTHRDGNNALLMDSVFFFGNHKGGEFLLPSLGLAYHGLHGYSFHGPFRILLHGVAQFHFAKEELSPQRYSVAMWSRASSFSAIARHSSFVKGNKVFSNKKLWLPILPKYEKKLAATILEEQFEIRRTRGAKKPKTQASCTKDNELKNS